MDELTTRFLDVMQGVFDGYGPQIVGEQAVSEPSASL
jgi:hypothetical protein